MGTKSKGRRVALVMAWLALALVVFVTGRYWRELRAWYVLNTQFELVPSRAEGDQEFRHKKTGIVFVLHRSKP